VGAVSELFDTNILIDHLNGIAKATRELKRSNGPAISTITWIEVMTGASSAAEEMVLRSFLLNFECLPKMPDAIILATAEVAGRELVTRNVKDFPGGMRGVRVPYKV
jgi:predicted nucleic acid-binding protein